MRNISFLVLLLLCTNQNLKAQSAPFSPEDWPATKNPAKKVHYVTTDSSLAPVSANWLADQLQILSGGDQGTAPVQ